MPDVSRVASVLSLLLTACTARPSGDGGAAPNAAAWKPVSFAVLEDYDKRADLREVGRDFHLLKQLGVPTWRGSFGWDDYEPEPGVYDFEWLEAFVRTAADSGIALRPYVGYTPEWAARTGRDGEAWNDPPADLGRWSAFVDTLAAVIGRHGNVLSWEIYNEVNVPQWWEGTVAEYNAVLAAAAERMRARDPDAEVLAAGLVWPDAEWMEATCAAYGNASAFDVAAFHAYPGTWTPDSVVVENYLGADYLNGYLPVVREACGGKPIWMNEVGFATTPGTTEREQAAWWVRAVATFLAAPGIEHIGIYEIKDLAEGREAIGDEPNYHLGLTYPDRTPKLAFHTVALLVDLLGTDSLAMLDAEVDAQVVSGRPASLQAHLFLRPDGDLVLFVWDTGGGPTVDVELERPGGEAVRYSLEGVATAVPDFDGRTFRSLRLEPGEPVILRIPPP